VDRASLTNHNPIISDSALSTTARNHNKAFSEERRPGKLSEWKIR